jgi:hypothetical protein
MRVLGPELFELLQCGLEVSARLVIAASREEFLASLQVVRPNTLASACKDRLIQQQ